MDRLNHGVAWLLISSWAVPVILIGFILGCGGILWTNYKRHHRPIRDALERRRTALAPVIDADRIDEAQRIFADRFDEIAAVLAARDGGEALSHAWVEYRETLIGTDTDVLQSTAHPENYFLHLGDNTRVIAWWANLFVAIGLTFTFLGIIAALTQTSDNIAGVGGDASAMSGALIALLTLTAAKFWTSIAGVAGSIVLRIVDRRWHSATSKQLEILSNAIERGTVHVPAQRIAFLQLRQLEQQSTALTEFSHQLAVSIGDALHTHMQPVVAGLTSLQASLGEQLQPLGDIRNTMDEFRSGSMEKVGEVVSQSAGSQMDALAGAIAAMTEGLGTVNDRLEGASGQASEQIAAAAREFSGASDAMTKAFGTLNGQINGIADRLVAQAAAAGDANARRLTEERQQFEAMAAGQRDMLQSAGAAIGAASSAATADMVAAVRDAVTGAVGESNAAVKAALDGFAGATGGIQTAFDQMRGQIAEIGTTLSGGAAQAADRNAEVLARAATALEQATAQASAGMSAAVTEAVTRSAEESGKAIASAFATFGERFDAASAGLIATLTTTAGRMETLAGAIERSTGSADAHATKLADAGREAQGVATMLTRAAGEVQNAAAPIAQAAGGIREALTTTHDLVRTASERAERGEGAMREVADGLNRTASAAGTAWENYRTRFEAVDASLEKALVRIHGASLEHAEAMGTQTARVDSALADAVTRMGTSLAVLEEFAQSLENWKAPR